MAEPLWDTATKAAVEVAEYFRRYSLVEAVLAGAVDGLTKDQLAERIRPLLEQAPEDAAKDVARYRMQLLAAATTRAPVQ